MTSYTDETVSNLIINKLTKAQYDAITAPSETELYIVTDEEALPSQTGQSGKYLTTNGTTASWATVSGGGSSLPDQTGQSGKFLTTNGTTASWATVSQPSIATTSTAGLVKPDGITVTITNDGTISASGGGSSLPSQTNNSGKFLTTNGTTASWGNVIIPFGESTSAADAVQKEVTISEITELKTGQIIIVKPTVTSTVANATLKLNNFTAYPMLYGAAAITTSTDSITWAANYPSWFRFDGSNWVFLGHGVDNNTTYSAMSVAEGTTGTKTTARSVRADYLKQIIQGTKLTGLSTSTNSAVAATDTILVAIGKLQAQIGDIESAINTIRGV